MKNRRGFTLIELIIVIVVLAILFFAFIAPFFIGIGRFVGGINSTMSEGGRTGTVIKFGVKTNFYGGYKSYEGAVKMSDFGLSSQNKPLTSSISGNIWEFSLYEDADPALIKKIEEAQNSQQPVTLKYTQWWSRPATISTEYVITGIETIHSPKPER